MPQDNVVKLPSNPSALKKGGKCPICSKKVQETYKPFCSKRCADIDLGQWLGEGYRLPTDDVVGYDEDFGDDG